MLMNTDLINLRSDILKEKRRDKLNQMIRLFKEIKALTKTTKWEVDSIKHDVVANNTKEMIIKEVLIKKCSFYYQFEKMMSDLSIIIFSFIMKFTQSDIFENVTRMKEDSNNQFTNEDDWNSQNNVKKFILKTTCLFLYSNWSRRNSIRWNVSNKLNFKNELLHLSWLKEH